MEAHTDAFAALFGGGRGALELDTLLSLYPTDAARACLADIVDQSAFSKFSEALIVLRQHHAVIDERPLLGDLVRFVCARMVFRAVAERECQVRDAAHALAVRLPYADVLFGGSDRLLHIFSDGGAWGTAGHHESVCGVHSSRSDLARAQRGAWIELSKHGLSRCERCAARAGEFADCAERSPAPALARPLLDELRESCGRELSALVRRRVAAGLLDADAIRGAAQRTVRRALIRALVSEACAGGPALTRRMHTVSQWRQLTAKRDVASLDAGAAMDPEEWEELAGSLLPEDDYAPMDERRRAQTASLARQWVCSGLGVPSLRPVAV